MTMSVTKQPDSKELMEALKKGVIEAKAAKAAEEAEARAIEEAKDKAALEGLIEPEDLKKDKAEQ
jgi:predicted RNA-binding protein associated with RNAse of E/G family